MSTESKQTPWRYFFHDGEFHAHEDGCWMDAKDYDALLAERDRIASDRDAKTARMWELGKECDALQSQLQAERQFKADALEKQCRAESQNAELVNEVAGHHFVRNERDRLLAQNAELVESLRDARLRFANLADAAYVCGLNATAVECQYGRDAADAALAMCRHLHRLTNREDTPC